MTEYDRRAFLNLLAAGSGKPPVYDLTDPDSRPRWRAHEAHNEERPALREQRPADNRPN